MRIIMAVIFQANINLVFLLKIQNLKVAISGRAVPAG
jgi:hypothetical protein